MQNKHYLFDVDGTLTPSRQVINPVFADFFLAFCKNNSVSTVSGSNYEKTVEQLGEEICSALHYIFSCSGNNVRNNLTKLVETKPLLHIPGLENRLIELLKLSTFTLRTGKHIEYRPGGINFSIVGRNASIEERSLYVAYDTAIKERQMLADLLNREFPNLEVSIGGETGLDIVALGCNKSQVTQYFDNTELLFFGDAMYKSGNDYSLAKAIKDNNLGQVYPVNSWEDTYKILLALL